MHHWRRTLFLVPLGLLLLVPTGCTRSKYRLHADRDAYGVLREKAHCTPWRPPNGFSVYPHRASRWHDPTPTDDPCLPVPSPQLYTYSLPEMPERAPSRFQPRSDAGEMAPHETLLPDDNTKGAIVPSTIHEVSDADSPADDSRIRGDTAVRTAAHDEPARIEGLRGDSAQIQLAQIQAEDREEIPPPPAATGPVEFEDDLLDEEEIASAFGLKRVPIPATYWESVPPNCLRRMWEFASVRDEFTETYHREPDADQRDDAPRLALEDIIDQASLNSRDLQTQKEILYRVALGLSLERFDYQLKPSVGGNNSAANYAHNRVDGRTVNTLGIPTSFQIDRMFCTGADLLARFANSVVLTFNGPQGFAADIGSELLFDFSQSLLQRDIRLESLTQAERNVVYAARDFTRFRRELFVDLSAQYYSLIRQFRQVEIDSQNYFALVREFNQLEAEFRAGLASRIQLDQVEQQVISGRRGLLSTCTNLDNALDDLKIRIGVPTEEPLNIDLTELNLLTLRDELAVNGELIKRVRRRLITERNRDFPARATLLSAGSVLIERIQDSLRLRAQLGSAPTTTSALVEQGLRMQTDVARLDVEDARQELENELESESPSQPIVFQRHIDIVNEQLEVIELQLQRAGEMQSDTMDPIATPIRQANEYRTRAQQLQARFDQLITDERLAEIPQLLADAIALEEDTAGLVQRLDVYLGVDLPDRTPQEQLEETIAEADALIQESENYLKASDGGLVPIEISMDDAMLTALVRRFDLVNERGFLADDWRQIKLAGDDLRSVLNLRATQSIRTRSGANQPFGFTFDDSRTSLSATFDAPFNRRVQRNAYRESLIDYQAALRRLALLEDTIKLSVRRDLRSLALDREQYTNDIASAALAFERVVSTELELRLGVGNVAARDFLESQNAYISALSNVASRHIDYITDRVQLFLDLELLDVGDDGFWLPLYDEDHQPLPGYQLPRYALPAYGTLSPCLKYSPEILRMQCVRRGTAGILRSTEDTSIPPAE